MTGRSGRRNGAVLISSSIPILGSDMPRGSLTQLQLRKKSCIVEAQC